MTLIISNSSLNWNIKNILNYKFNLLNDKYFSNNTIISLKSHQQLLT